MNAKAFISHTERGGTDIGRIIQDQLKTSDHQMESFLSQHSIEQGERIPEKILRWSIYIRYTYFNYRSIDNKK